VPDRAGGLPDKVFQLRIRLNYRLCWTFTDRIEGGRAQDFGISVMLGLHQQHAPATKIHYIIEYLSANFWAMSAIPTTVEALWKKPKHDIPRGRCVEAEQLCDSALGNSAIGWKLMPRCG